MLYFLLHILLILISNNVDINCLVMNFGNKKIAFVSGYVGISSTNIPKLPHVIYDCYFITNNEKVAIQASEKKWKIIMINETSTGDQIENAMASKKLKVFPQYFIPVNYDFLIWFDNKFNVNTKGVLNVISTWNNETAMMLHKHPFLCCGADLEFKESMKQKRYFQQKDQYIKYMNEEVKKGYPIHGKRHFQTGFLIYNLLHPITVKIQKMWMNHIIRCGIQCQISFYFVAQRFPEKIDEYIYPIS